MMKHPAGKASLREVKYFGEENHALLYRVHLILEGCSFGIEELQIILEEFDHSTPEKNGNEQAKTSSQTEHQKGSRSSKKAPHDCALAKSNTNRIG